jgi:hypothetical protein
MSSSSLSVAPGSSGNLTVTVAPKNGFKQAVGFTCAGLPDAGSCAFNPQTVIPIAGAVSATLTVRLPTAAGTEAPPIGALLRFYPTALYIFALGIWGIAGGVGIKRTATRNRNFARAFLTSAVFAALLATANCAGYSGQKTGQPASTYVVTITASAASAPTHTQQFTLTVIP